MARKRMMGIWEQRAFMFMILSMIFYVGNLVEPDGLMLSAGLLSVFGAIFAIVCKFMFERGVNR